MATELKPLDIGDNPDLLRLVEQIQRADAPRVLQHDGRDVAVVTPIKRAKKSPRPRPTRPDDPLWRIVGLAGNDEDLDPNRPTDVSSNKDKYLAEAYADLHEDR